MEKINLNLSSWQGKVWHDQHRFIVVNCGRRAGKTTLVAWKLFDFATKAEIKDKDGKKIDATVWYVAPTYRQAKNILWEMLQDIIPLNVIKKKNETELKITLVNNAQIHVKGADLPDSLRGVRIDFCVFDECAFIDRWEKVWGILRPTLMDSRAKCMFISTPNGFNHFKDLADTIDPLYSYYHFTSYDNPYISKDELDETRNQMDEDSYYQEIMGEFRKMKGLIYKDFRRETHMVDLPHFDGNWSFTRTLDFGFAHKTALVYFAISPDFTAIYGYDGLYVSGFTTRQIAEIIKVKDAGKIIINPLADSAQPQSIADLAELNVHFNPVEKGKDSVKNGIVKVAELLKVRKDTGKPTLMFNKYLDWIATEFEKYRWIENRKDTSTVREIPYAIENDAMDAIRYMAMGLQNTNEDYWVPEEKQLEGWY